METVKGNPPVVLATCGQNVEINSLTNFLIFQIMCPQFNGSQVYWDVPQQRAFKDGVEIVPFRYAVLVGPFPPPTEEIYGTYTFVVENSCGRDVEVSKVHRPGQF